MFKKVFRLCAFAVCMMMGITACSGDGSYTSTEDTSDKAGDAAQGNTQGSQAPAQNTSSNPRIRFEMEDGTVYVAELYSEYAPKTVENFVKLVSEGFYNGLTFHRVIPGFMVQGGCPEGTGMGGSGKNIPGEFASNGFEDNTLSHTKGVISMARAQAPNSASSQFFICVDDASFLDGDYAAFGKIIEGMENVDAIAAVKTDMSDKPMTPVIMKSVTVVGQ